MYRRINPTSRQELPMRMLFQPLGNGTFHRACEADSFRGLVAAMLDDPAYERGGIETRLVARLEECPVAQRLKQHPQSELLSACWVDPSVHQATLLAGCQAERWNSQ